MSNSSQLLNDGYQAALEILKKVSTHEGFRASAGDDGYKLVWTRDSMITLLCTCCTGDKDLLETSRRTLETLRQYQEENGWIPNSIDPKKKSFERLAPDGYDNCSWYVIGVSALYSATQDKELLQSHWENIKAALNWLWYHQSSQGMLYIGEAGDWQDLFSVRGHGLYANILYSLAAREASKIAHILNDKEFSKKWKRKSEEIAYGIDERLWMDPERFAKRLITHRSIEFEWEHSQLQILSRSVMLPYYIAFLGYRDSGTYFDTFGNTLAILAGVSSEEKTNKILDYMNQIGIDHPYPSRAIYPAVRMEEPQWRRYFLTLNLNLPHQYHNGGVWPFLGGFHILALIKANRRDEAATMLEKLAQGNKVGKHNEWEFNEWHHGRTGRPMGMEWQTWSAALYILAHNAVMQDSMPEIFK